ncbi:DUF7096 domain-containing protein [Natrinema halophilum]|uniref:Uncharacterized protein n=1 Tax=Natrinema halophilum TaxID=1699371 RepID=A0A7D5KDJ8_9EURY|nr:hypothetical protein [Natrinema halophilum]QLG49496.1 hypothetical protein HYG82_11795 [Natrinema halophilum]
MNNAAPALLALLLVLSVPAATVGAAAPTRGTDEQSVETSRNQIPPRLTQTDVANTTNRLHLNGDIRSEYTEYRPDLGMVLASADDELRIDHGQYALVEEEFTRATPEERAAMVQAAYERLKQQADRLERRERNAVTEHADGDRSTAQLLQTLLRNHNEAAVLSERLDELDAKADRIPGYSLPSRQTRVDKNIFSFHRTSLRTQLDWLSKTPNSGRNQNVIVSTSQSGYSISMMKGSNYIVETTRFDNRNETASDQFEDLEAFERTIELYPWADEHGSPHFQDNSPDHYWTEIGHSQGRLEIYLDAGSGEVHREVQELIAPSLPSEYLGPWTGDGLNMTMNRTPANGPVEVTVTDQETGEPVSATITFDGVEVGNTGEDGTLWVAPLIGKHKLEAKTANGVVNATVSR